jgi:two-component system sensor histidine kinase CiaH
MTAPFGSQVARQSTRVALWATGLVALLYAAVAIAIVAWLTVSLTAQIDERLGRTLDFETSARAIAGQQPVDVPPEALPVAPPGAADGAVPRGPLPFGRDRAFWFIAADGSVTSLREDLLLPADHYEVTAPTTIDIDGTQLRIAGRSLPDGHLVVGESLAPLDDARTSVILGLLAIAPILLISVFLGSLAVGRRVAMPIERARQRQLAFTADASHELRTPLSVIEANASLALAAERDEAWYRRAFERVQDESRRMRRLVEELLWLARFDAMQRPPAHEPVDLGVLVDQAADRFAAPAEARSLSLQVRHDASGVTLSAPPEWLDQLVGVLLDNACKYCPVGGSIVVSVANADRRARLTVDDSGPGIPDDRRDQVFDRFHRDTSEPGGTGLGLAIADAIVRATSGRWLIETSPQGGARMSVSWPIAAGGPGGS